MDDKDKYDSELNKDNAADKPKDEVDKDLVNDEGDKSKDKCEDVSEDTKSIDSEKTKPCKEREPRKDSKHTKSKKAGFLVFLGRGVLPWEIRCICP